MVPSPPLLQFPDHVESRQSWHVHVEKHQVVGLFVDLPQGVGTGFDTIGDNVASLKQVDQQLAVDRSSSTTRARMLGLRLVGGRCLLPWSWRHFAVQCAVAM